jgi:hypothetical protein
MLNRKGLPSQMKHNILKKMKTHEVVAYRKEDNMSASAWKDKRTVSVLSTWHNAQTQPYVPRGREFEPISKPTVICDYTAKMRGVDIACHYTSAYNFGQK